MTLSKQDREYHLEHLLKSIETHYIDQQHILHTEMETALNSATYAHGYLDSLSDGVSILPSKELAMSYVDRAMFTINNVGNRAFRYGVIAVCEKEDYVFTYNPPSLTEPPITFAIAYSKTNKSIYAEVVIDGGMLRSYGNGFRKPNTRSTTGRHKFDENMEQL